MKFPRLLKRAHFRLMRMAKFAILGYRTNNWDFSYTIDILNFALEDLAKSLETGYSLSGPNDAKDIRRVIAALKRTQTDYEDQTGLTKYNFEPDDTMAQIFNIDHIFRQNKEQMARAEYLRKQDWDYILKEFKTKSQGWWD